MELWTFERMPTHQVLAELSEPVLDSKSLQLQAYLLKAYTVF